MLKITKKHENDMNGHYTSRISTSFRSDFVMFRLENKPQMYIMKACLLKNHHFEKR